MTIESVSQHRPFTGELFVRIFRTSPVAISISTFDEGYFLEVNDSFLRTTGYRRDEVIGHRSTELSLWATREDRERVMQELLDHYAINDVEITVRTKSGEMRYVLAFFELFDLEGQACLLSMFHDITERKHAEAALLQAEHKYHTIFDHVAEGIFQSTADGRLISANPALANIFGYPSPEALVASIDDIARQTYVDPGQREILMHTLERDGVIEAFESQVYRRDGRIIWISENVRAVQGADGQLWYYEGTVEDITERKRAEEILKKLSSVVEQTTDNVFITNREGVIEYVNTAFEQLTGYSRADAIGQTPRLLRSGQHDEAFYRQLWSTILTGQSLQAVITNRKKNGDLYDEEKTITPLRDENGNITHFVSTGRDITERRRAEAVLRATQERMQLVLRATMDAVYDWDIVTGRTRWNHGPATLFGYAGEEVRDHTWWAELIHPDDRERAIAGIAETLARRDQFWSCEYRYRRVNGSYAHVLDRGYFIYADSGQPVRMIGVMVDITDHVLLAEAQVRAAMEERQRLARDLHDSVTQSLYSLTLLAEAARRTAKAGDLRKVEAHVARLGETAQQSLKEMRLLVYELRPSALEKEGLIGALQQRLDAVEKRSGVEARLLIENVDPLPGPIEQALYHIAMEALNNALKHAEATIVSVKLSVKEDVLTLELGDNGKGFDRSTAADSGGLGLTNLRERVELLGGTLTIDSTPGQGTRIMVHVPLHHGEAGHE